MSLGPMKPLLLKLVKAIRPHSASIAAALILFLANQTVELAVLKWLSRDYSSMCIWDCGWYASIVEHGYDLAPGPPPRHNAANWAFFPVLPLLAKGIQALLGQSSDLALILTGKITFLLSIFAFVKFGQIYDRSISAWMLATTVALSPYAIYGNTGYTESTFLLFTCLFFVRLKSGAYVQAGFAGAVLTATRAVGLASGFATLVFALWRWRNESRDARYRLLTCMILIPLGITLFMFYLYWLCGDALAFSHVQIAWDRHAQNPATVFFRALIGRSAQDRLRVLTAVVGILCCVYLAFRRLPELSVFTALGILIPLATGIDSMQRYVSWQAPVLLAFAMILHKSQLRIPMAFTSAAGLIFMHYAWLTGRGFVT